MHYNINDDIIIKSENAAKSYTQPNKYLLDMIKDFANVDRVLDYGCGKLRYTIPLCELAKEVIAIDSNEQILRKQKIWNEKTSVMVYSNKIDNLEVYSLNDTKWKEYKYDFILCSNVLSAIPNDLDRIKVLNNIKSILSYKGKALITTLYRNSYFSLYKMRESSIKYHDGWIVKNGSLFSFYGLISVEKLINYCINAGLIVDDVIIRNGSVFVVVANQ